MAELKPDGGELVLTLTPFEKAESLHGDIRVPMSAVRAVEVVDDVIHAVHGMKMPGSRWPGKFAVGRFIGPIGDKKLATSFVVIHHDTPRGVRVALEGADFKQLLVGTDDPVAVKNRIAPTAPGMNRAP